MYHLLKIKAAIFSKWKIILTRIKWEHSK
jgi:hypothetical protein